VTHRSPLVTLVGLVAAFAIMFGVNLASSAPRDSYFGGQPSASPAASTPASTPTPAASPTETATPSPSVTASAEDDSEFPDKIVYAGRSDNEQVAIAVAILGQRAAAYLCDGDQVEAWLRGTVTGDEISLTGKNGETLEAKLDGSALRGEVEIGDQKLDFRLREAKPPAGLYRAKGSKTTIGWIVLPDGSQVGIQTTAETSGPAPQFDPDNPEVTVDGESLQGEPVTGDLDV
jgi:hypothetical protein